MLPPSFLIASLLGTALIFLSMRYLWKLWSTPNNPQTAPASHNDDLLELPAPNDREEPDSRDLTIENPPVPSPGPSFAATDPDFSSQAFTSGLAEKEMAHNTRIQALLMEMASTYIHLPTEKLDQAINQSLQAMGEIVGADRSYLFDYDFAGDFCTNTHEWCAPGITPQIHELQHLPNSLIVDWVHAHKQGETIFIADVSQLPEENPVRPILEEQDIKSVLTVPLMKDGDCLGFVGFDSVRNFRHYTDMEHQLLRFFARMLENVRRRRELEEHLKESRLRAEQANRAKSEFLANMSHELRTPLNGVIGMTELLKDSGLNSGQERFADMILHSGESLLQMINDILDYSKLESGRLNLQNEIFDLHALCHLVSGLLTPGLRRKQLSFRTDIDPNVPRLVTGDAARLKQVLMNILGNALKFTEAGHISLQLKLTPPDPNSRPGSIPVLFTIRDTGIGIAPEHQALLFEKFQQVDGSTTRRFGGTGLGLALSRQIVELMEGQIGVSSPLGNLPPNAETASEAAAGKNASSPVSISPREPREGPGSEFWFTVRLGSAEEFVQAPSPAPRLVESRTPWGQSGEQA